MEPLALFAELFEGRTDAYGTEDGGCERVACGHATWELLWEQHVDGTHPIGVYPIVYKDTFSPHWYVRWGCVDFDVKTKGKPSWDYEDEAEAHVAADNLQRTLNKLGINAWVEKTRSAGRHVWVFASEWVPAKDMRYLLKLACKIAGVSDREVNPKQVELAEGKLGNYVRLPYTHADLEHRYMIWPNGERIPFNVFVSLAHAERTDALTIAKWAQHWHEPERPEIPVEYVTPVGAKTLTDRLNGLAWTMYQEGPLDGDRSMFLLRFAHKCRESDLSMPETLQLLDHVEAPLGKFAGRADRIERLQDIVRSAYR